MSREPLELGCQFDCLTKSGIGWIQAAPFERAIGNPSWLDSIAFVRVRMDIEAGDAAEPVELIGGEPEYLSHLTERALAAISDDLGHHGCTIASVSLVDLLDDLLAPLVLEVDIDVRRLSPRARHEALEQKRTTHRIHCCDPQRITNGTVCCAPSSLTENAARSCDVHDLLDGQEVWRDLQLGDERQLLVDLRAHFFRNTVGIAIDETNLDGSP